MEAMSNNTSDTARIIYLLRCPDDRGVKCRLLARRMMLTRGREYSYALERLFPTRYDKQARATTA